MSPTPPAPRRARLLGISVLSAVFVAGALASAAVGRLLDAREASAAPQTASAPACKAEKRGRMIDQIDLSPEQRRQVDAIVERRRAQREAFWDNEGQRMRAIMDSTRIEIRGVLLPAQQAEYDRLVAEHRARSEARRAAADSARTTGAQAGPNASSRGTQ